MANTEPLDQLHTLPDAEQQCRQLADLLRPALPENPALVGIHSGGAWIAERLCTLLGLPTTALGTLDISFYRDDFAEKGLPQEVKASSMPFDMAARHVILVDDVLYTGRTTRAALNELFDYGRPASIALAVLADRGGRELPIAAEYCVWHVAVPQSRFLVLNRTPAGKLAWSLQQID